MFAGPNGFGKTTLIREVAGRFDTGALVNADKIEFEINRKKYLDCGRYLTEEQTQDDWDVFMQDMGGDSRLSHLDFTGISIDENYLVARQEINSYHASIIAEFFRKKLLLEDKTFSFETVMSHESKVTFLSAAKSKGFKTYLYFICTQDPKINEIRVKNRVRKGGHKVTFEKIKSRYHRALELLCQAFLIADRAYILDNSGRTSQIIVEKDLVEVMVKKDEIPEWVGTYVLDKLK